MNYTIVDITDLSGNVIANDWLTKSETVHRQLRPKMPADYTATMLRIFNKGARMCVATYDTQVVGVGVYRVLENTSSGLHMYVDDLVTDESKRSTGAGKKLLAHMQELARHLNCKTFKLDSGTQRQQAHKFYFREGLVVQAFHFMKILEP